MPVTSTRSYFVHNQYQIRSEPRFVIFRKIATILGRESRSDGFELLKVYGAPAWSTEKVERVPDSDLAGAISGNRDQFSSSWCSMSYSALTSTIEHVSTSQKAGLDADAGRGRRGDIALSARRICR
jgi:hypothetical protein